MKRISKRHLSISTAVLLLAGALHGCGSPGPDPVPGPATSPPSSAPAPGPQGGAGTLDEQLAEVARRAPAFGGMFTDEQGQLAVYLLAPTPETGAAARGGDAAGDVAAAIAAVFGPERLPASGPGLAISGPRLRVLPGQFSFLDLKDWHDRMAPAVLSLPGVTLTDISESKNRLVIGLHGNDARTPVQGLLAQLRIPAEAVLLEEVQPVQQEATLRDRVRPVYGGQQVAFGAALCTLGFNATRQGVAGIVVNSHCTNTQGGVEGTIYSQPNTGSGNQIGVETADPGYFVGGACPAARRCRRSDSAFLARNAGVDGTRGGIARTDLNASTILGNYRIVGSTAVLVGDTVNKVGRTTGRTQGSISRTCVNLNVADTNITLLCQNQAGYDSARGDSGSPVFRITNSPLANDVQLAGIHWGSGGAFSPIANILEAGELGPLDVHFSVGYEVAFQTNTGTLYVAGSLSSSNTGSGMKPGTSPGIAALPGGGYQVAFQANTGNLYVTGTLGSSDTGLGMKTGTSPSIAALPGGGYQVAFQANTGNLYVTGALGSSDTGLGMKTGTSPSIAALPGGGYQVAFQANTGKLYLTGALGSSDTGLGMMAGTGPSIAALPGGGYQVAFQANTGNLYLTGALGSFDTGLGMKTGTGPCIAALPGGGYQVAFQANTGNLYLTGALGSFDTGLGMKTGTGPSIAALPGGGYQAAFQANTGTLYVTGALGSFDTGLGMMAGTNPSIW